MYDAEKLIKERTEQHDDFKFGKWKEWEDLKEKYEKKYGDLSYLSSGLK